MKQVEFLPQVSICYSHSNDGDFRGCTGISDQLAAAGYKPPKLSHLKLVHGDTVVILRAAKAGLETADSAVLSGGVGGLSLVVADCIPIVLVDPVAKVLALVHGGWRSLAAKIVQKTITQMAEQGAKPDHIWAWIGPGIRPCCYRSAGRPVQGNEQEWCSFISQIPQFEQEKNDSNTEWRIDLPGYINSVFQNAKIPQDQILDEALCSCCERESLYSHQRSKQTGEQDGRFFVTVFWK